MIRFGFGIVFSPDYESVFGSLCTLLRLSVAKDLRRNVDILSSLYNSLVSRLVSMSTLQISRAITATIMMTSKFKDLDNFQTVQ